MDNFIQSLRSNTLPTTDSRSEDSITRVQGNTGTRSAANPAPSHYVYWLGEDGNVWVNQNGNTFNIGKGTMRDGQWDGNPEGSNFSMSTNGTRIDNPNPSISSGAVEYTYKPGDTFGQVLLDTGLSTPENLWGEDGDVAYYTKQLRSQGINGNIPIGTTISLLPRKRS